MSFRFIIAICCVLAAGLLSLEVFNLKPNNKIKRSPSSFLHDSYKEVDFSFIKNNHVRTTCEKINNEVLQLGYPYLFNSIQVFIRDEDLHKSSFLSELKTCLTQEKEAPLDIEIEIFNSDHVADKGHDIQFQISLFDSTSKNKVFEFGFVFNL